MTVHRILNLGILFLLLGFMGFTGQAESRESQYNEYYRFGVFPLQSPIKLAKLLMPFVDQLEYVLGKPVQFLTAPDIPTFNDRASQHEYDIIYLYPQESLSPDYVDYKIIAELIGESFTGILVVRKDSEAEIMKVDSFPNDLEIGLPSGALQTTSVMTQQNLKRLGIDLNETAKARYFGSHDSALLGLYYGLVDMVATWQISLDSMPMTVRNSLQMVRESQVQPSMIIAVRRDFPETEVVKIKTLLSGLSKSERGYRSLINPVITIEGLGLLQERSKMLNNEYKETHE